MNTLHHGTWQQTLHGVVCDTLITDAPYGIRTHQGHNGDQVTTRTRDKAARRSISYDSLTPADVDQFVQSWAPRCRQWMVSITCDGLAHVWRNAYDRAGLCSFAALPWVAPGGSVRLMGDGPASWACWIMVARQRTGNDRYGRAVSKWGALPGAYTARKERGSHIGGKPLQLMQALVRDYSRPGDLVCDPFAGFGTTLAAAARAGRQYVGAEVNAETYAHALQYIEQKASQMGLFSAMSGQQMTIGGVDAEIST